MLKQVRQSFLILIILFLGNCSENKNSISEPNGSSTSFVIMGDRTGGHIEGVFPIVLAKALETEPEFMIDVGDLIEGYTENYDTLTTQWVEYFNLIKDVNVPFYHTPGNHDLWYAGQMEHYLHYIGKPYYSVNINNIHFIILDNTRWTPDSAFYLDGEQMLWLKDDLLNNRQQFTFVFCHRPFWDKSITDSTIINSSFHEYLISQEVDAVIAGHYHNYFQTKYDGITYVMAGRSGGASTVGHPYFTPKDIRYEAPIYEEHRFLSVTINDSIIIESHIVSIE